MYSIIEDYLAMNMTGIWNTDLEALAAEIVALSNLSKADEESLIEGIEGLEGEFYPERFVVCTRYFMIIGKDSIIYRSPVLSEEAMIAFCSACVGPVVDEYNKIYYPSWDGS